jgi:AraC-like DNA-binding protein
MLPEGLYYERFAPTPASASYVEHLWVVRGPPLAETRQEILIPNGRPTVLCCLGDPGCRLHIRRGTRTPNGSSLGGLITEPLILEQRGRSIYAAAQLTPWGLAALAPGRPLVDETQPLDRWAGDKAAMVLLAAMAETELGEPTVRMLETFLISRLKPLPPTDLDRLQAAIAAIEEAEGAIEVEQLVLRLGTTYAALYRLFKARIGISPKQFISITRYYRLVGGLLSGKMAGGLAQLALMQGYYDQAHASKDFRRFTGVSQTEFRRTLNGIALLMHGG